MGGGSSRPSILKAPPIIREDEPPVAGTISFGLGDSQGCSWNGNDCQLTVGRGLSSSGAKLYREQGGVTAEECGLFLKDAKLVQNNQLAFEEMKTKALAGKYYAALGNGYCAQYPPKSPEEMRKLAGPIWGEWGGLWANLTPVSIRKLTTEGGYSSITKLFIKPSIPFKVTFNGETYTISLMTLFHPSPIRLENVQHDAILTLGDPAPGNRAKGNGATDAVILIPLVGSLNPGPSGDFLSKVTRYLSAVLQPDPASGQYNTVDIPTGNDWDLSKMFPGTPSEGATVVDAGYYIWNASPGMAKATTPEVTVNPWPTADIHRYKYVPTERTNLRYIMLQKPVGVNVFDMQTIRMLPATPADQALDAYIPSSLSYVTPKSCETPPAGRESMTNGGDNTCDPFANVSAATNGSDRTELLIKVIIGTLTTFGVLLAVYFALKLFTNRDWSFKLPRWGVLAGNFMVNAPLDKDKQVPPPSTFVTPDIDTLFGSKAESRLSTVKSSSENPMRKPKAKTDEGTPDIDTLFGSKAEERLGEVKSTSEQPMARAKRSQKAAEAIERARVEAEGEAAAKAKADAEAIETARIEAEARVKREEEEMAKAIEASRVEAEAKAKRDAEQAAEDARREAEYEAEERAKEAKRAADEAVLRRNGPAGTGLDFTDEQLAQNAEVERARVEAEAQAKLQKEAEATKALFAEAKARKEKEEADAKEAVEASIRKEKEALDAAEEARIKAEAERVAASASDVASKTLKRRTVKSSDRDLAKAEAKLAAAEAERKRQLADYEAKQKEAIRAAEPGAEGRASAGVPTAKGERPPAAPPAAPPKPPKADRPPVAPPAAPLKGRVETSSSDAMAVPAAESLRSQVTATLTSIGKQETFINANPPTKEHPNRLFNQRLETRLNGDLKTLDRQLTELETLVAKFPADKGLERMAMTRFIKQTQDKEKKSLTAQNQRFEVLGKIIKEGPAMKGGRRRKRRSTRRYVA